MAKRPAPPPALGAKGTALWKEIAWKYELRPDELSNLEDACLAKDVMDDLWKDMAATPLKTKGSQGQDVINPTFPEWRQYSMLAKSHLAALKIPDEAPGIKGVVKQTPATAHKSRAAARAAWGIAQ